MNKRRIKVSGIFFLCLFILTGCHGYSSFEVEDNVKSVYLFYYENPEVKYVNDLLGLAKHSDFEFYRMLPVENIEILPNEQLQDFIKDVSGRSLFNHANHQNAPNETAIMIYYESGEFDVISDWFVGRYTKEGKNTRFFGTWGTESRVDLVNTYFSGNSGCTAE